MKKNPIYLWVLLVLSALISSMSLFGILSPLPSKDVLRTSLANSGTLTAQQLEDTVNYTYKVSESSHSIFNMLLIILSAILVVVAFVFLVRKNVQLANYTYIGYVLLAIVGLVYSYMNIQDAVQLIKDSALGLGMGALAKGTDILFIIINVLFLALVFYKMWRQQKDLTEEVEAEEVA
ncbi:ABC transporter permease [Streptococcus halitosis]|uniref:ABC transporter permease n=2 Tax=Streptococcus TaxID=1301 RepID=A0A1X1FV01_STROR|nr:MULTISPECIES: ABC transporter permease [Streptococcus]ORO38108.1 ABC transporter permease [Streptococcus oralis subsp. tigurinus]RRN47236.1 ABC transporter permease [Streptococcus halitosis]